ARATERSLARLLRRTLRDRRAERHLLPPAETGRLRGLGAAGSGRLRVRPQGEPLPDPRPPSPPAPRLGRLPARRSVPAGPAPRPGPRPAATRPAGRAGSPRRDARRLPGRGPGCRRGPPPIVVLRRGPG